MFGKAGVCCCVALCLLVTAACPVNGAPRLVIDESEFDFGYIPQDCRVSHSFWLKSVGDDSLKITKVKTLCGCTKAPLERTELSAGDSTHLEVIFDSKGYRDRIVKSARIETNEGPPPKTVRFSARVFAPKDSTYPVIITPFMLDFSSPVEALQHEMGFSISNLSGRDLRVTLVDLPSDYLEVSFPPTLSVGETADCRITLLEGAEASFEKSVTIELDDENSTRFTIPVRRVPKAVQN